MKRVTTGLLLGFSLLFLLLYADAFWFFVLIVLTVGLALREYYKICLICQDNGLVFTGTLLGVIVPVALYVAGPKWFGGYLIFAVFFIFAYCLFTHKELASITNRIGIGVLGIVYIAFPMSHLILLRGLEQGSLWIIFLFLIIIANDTFAYYGGRRFGRHKLSPTVSPNKTVEGAAWGLAGGVIIAIAFQQFFLIKSSIQEIVALSVFIGILGQLSDLFESLIKRSAGVKDSGSILPGHGGALDRIDSLIFPIPALYYYLIIFRV